MLKLNKEKLHLSNFEDAILNKINQLKSNAGSHSPSIFNLLENIPEITLKVDACFLSNPYATDLFENYLNQDIIEKNRLRELLEFYPSQNQVIANNLANALNVNKENLFVSNGAIEVIQAIMHKYSKKVVLPIPTFSAYYEFLANDAKISLLKLDKENDYKISLTSLIDFVKKEVPDTVVIIKNFFLNKFNRFC